ncbi:hypothetical protein [Massilia sp. S19_KUP03_FR1]|uniref:hypothetical protein n=1 Tax=Massilia sp. S19_KUP03_FR1 TaxID=3025503 RepID=UPI002FCDBD58
MDARLVGPGAGDLDDLQGALSANSVANSVASAAPLVEQASNTAPATARRGRGRAGRNTECKRELQRSGLMQQVCNNKTLRLLLQVGCISTGLHFIGVPIRGSHSSMKEKAFDH